jgi:16S rRNA (guanine966-N2)-methyltransferase
VGLEAVSRGAEHALLVEYAAAAVRTIRANIASLGLPGADVAADRVLRALARGPAAAAAFDLVFADPPYDAADAELPVMLAALRDHGWLKPGALVVVERATRLGPFAWPAGYTPERSRRYGDATLWYGLAAAGESA